MTDRPFPIYLGRRVLLSQIRHRYAHMLTGPLPFFLPSLVPPIGPSFPASVVRIFSLNGVSRSAAPPGSSVVREKSPSPRPSVRAAYAEVLARRRREEGGRTATTGKKRNLCVSPQFSSLSESVPHPRERRETLPIRNGLIVFQAQGCTRLRIVPDQTLPKDMRFALFI